MHHFSVIKQYPLSASRLWSVFSNFSKSTNPSATIEIENKSDPDNFGIGAIRSTHIGKDTFREQLVAYEPDQSLTYKLLSGAPVEDYYGTITVYPEDQDHCRVEWHVKCKPKTPIPAWIIEKNAKKVIKGILEELYEIIN